MGKSNELEIRILAKNLAKEALADARKDLQGVGDAAKKGGADAKEGSKGIGDMVGALQKAASAYALVKVAQQAIEWAKEGAAIDAVEKRFVAFAGSAAAAEDILRAVGEATGGTIGRMSTMQSASKLTSMGLANNAEEVARLVEMATKLGDQTQATGDRVSAFGMMLANQSVEVLDNYGISSGQVRERIKELMAATSDMTREQAFLQATLELGEKTLIRLGDSTENMASSWDRLGAAIEDNTGKFKQLVAEALTPAAEGLYQIMTFSERTNSVLELNTAAAIASGKAWDAYAQAQLDAQYKAGRGNAVLREVNKALRESGERVLYHTATSENWNYVMANAIEYGIGFGETLDRISYEAIIAGNEAAAQGFSDVGASARRATEPVEDLSEALVTNFGSIEQMGEASKRAYSDMATAIRGDLGNEIQSFTEKQGEATASVAALSAKIGELESKRWLTAAQKAELEELRGELAKANEAVAANAAAHEEATKRILFGFMEQRLAVDGLTQAELMALQEVAGQWGLIDQATLNAIRGIDAVASSFESGKVSAESFGGILAMVGERLSGLPREHVFTMIYRESGPGPGGTPGSQRAEDREQMYATGGYAKGGWAMVGEYGPEMAWLPQGTRIHTAGETKRMLNEGAAGGRTEVYAPVTIHANVANGVDVALLARQVSDEIGRRVANRRNF